MRRFIPLAAVVLIFLCCHVVLAGAPLKGVDVKLGKNPGGLSAARTTDTNGQADFGVVPKGNYMLEFAMPSRPLSYKDPEDMTARYRPGNNKTTAAMQPSAKLHVVILGSSSGRIERDIDMAASAERVAPIALSLSGNDNLKVTITAE